MTNMQKKNPLTLSLSIQYRSSASQMGQPRKLPPRKSCQGPPHHCPPLKNVKRDFLTSKPIHQLIRETLMVCFSEPPSLNKAPSPQPCAHIICAVRGDAAWILNRTAFTWEPWWVTHVKVTLQWWGAWQMGCSPGWESEARCFGSCGVRCTRFCCGLRSGEEKGHTFFPQIWDCWGGEEKAGWSGIDMLGQYKRRLHRIPRCLQQQLA